MNRKPKKTAGSKPLTPTQAAEIKALAALPDERIDLSGVPEVRDWSDAKRGLLQRRHTEPTIESAREE